MEAFLKTITSPIWLPIWLIQVIFASSRSKDTNIINAPVRLLKWVFGGASAQPVSTTFGSAAFADYATLKKGGYLSPSGGFYLGFGYKAEKPWKHGFHRVFSHPETNVLMFGPPGVGKSNTLIANHRAIKLLPKGAPRPDIITVDQTGQIENASVETLIEEGYTVLRIDMINPTPRVEGQVQVVGYDPLGFVRTGAQFEYSRDDDCGALADLIIPEDAQKGASHWTDMPRAVLSGVIAHKIATEGTRTDLTDCLRALRGGKQQRDAFIKSMASSTDPLVSDAIDAYDSAGPDEKGSLGTSMLKRYAPFLTAPVRVITTPAKKENGRVDRGWTFDDMFRADKPIAIFLRTGLRGKRTGPVVRLIIGNAVNTVRRWQNEQGRPLPKGLRLFVDEAKTLGNCSPLEDLMDELRKTNCHAMLCYLSKADIYQAFPTAKNILNNALWIVPGGGNDYETSEDVSRLLGNTTAMSQAVNGQGASFHEVGKRLAPAEDVRGQEYERHMLIYGGFKADIYKPFRRYTEKGVRKVEIL